MSAHTPGPWRGPLATHVFNRATGREQRLFPKVQIGPRERDTIAINAGGETLDQCDANARLIAAAPDLLAVAQMWAEPLPYNPDEAQWTEPGDEALRAAYNAELKRRYDATSATIAKAVGK